MRFWKLWTGRPRGERGGGIDRPRTSRQGLEDASAAAIALGQIGPGPGRPWRNWRHRSRTWMATCGSARSRPSAASARKPSLNRRPCRTPARRPPLRPFRRSPRSGQIGPGAKAAVPDLEKLRHDSEITSGKLPAVLATISRARPASSGEKYKRPHHYGRKSGSSGFRCKIDGRPRWSPAFRRKFRLKAGLQRPSCDHSHQNRKSRKPSENRGGVELWLGLS